MNEFEKSNEKTDENHALFSYVIQSTCGFHVFSLGIKTHASHDLSHFYWLSNFELLIRFRNTQKTHWMYLWFPPEEFLLNTRSSWIFTSMEISFLVSKKCRCHCGIICCFKIYQNVNNLSDKLYFDNIIHITTFQSYTLRHSYNLRDIKFHQAFFNLNSEPSA